MPDPGPIYAAHLRRDVLVKGTALELARVSAVESARPVPPVVLYHTPQDPMFSRQWALNNTSQTYGCTLPSFNPGTDIHLPAALDMAVARGNGVRVGVLDSGVHSDHPELAGRVEPGFNAAADDWGLNWATEDSTSHGTAVAGIVAAANDNGLGIAGIAGDASIVPVRQSQGPYEWPYITQTRCLSDVGFFLGAALNGLWWAIDSAPTIPILNMSWGSYGTESEVPGMATACLAGLLKGQFLVAASGNDNWDDPAWVPAPARYAKRVFSVGAVFGNGLRWDDRVFPQPSGGWERFSWISQLPFGSNWGPHLTAVAPGGHMIASLRMYTLVDTTLFGHWWFDCAHKYFELDSCNVSYAVMDSVEFGGTSAAAPTVAGVAALLMGEHPGELVGEDITQVLVRTAVNPLTGAPSSGRSDTLGAGMIRADRALAFLASPKVIDHPRATSLAVADVDTVQVSFTGGTPEIPDGQYDAVRYRLVGRAAFSQALYAGTVSTWVRASGTQGMLDVSTYNYLADVPFGRITSIDTLGVDVETFVYKVLSGGNVLAWYPCDTASAAVATTSVGYPLALAGVSAESAPRFAITVSPTPSRGRAVLSLLCPGPAIVEAGIFDVQGRVVRHLGRRSVSGGSVQFVWDGRRDDGGYAADGVYYARGSANAQSKVVRVVLLR
jgi:subtilisin family serine protease